MKINKELARKLAKKIVNSVPKDKKSLNSVSGFLELLGILYKEEPKFRDFMLSPSVPNQNKKVFIKSLIQKGNIPKEIEFFVDELIDLNLLRIIPEIKRLFDYEAEKILSIYKGKLVLSKKLSEEFINDIIAKLEKALSKKIEPTLEINEGIIGGFVLKTSGLIVDASVKSALQNLSSKVKTL